MSGLLNRASADETVPGGGDYTLKQGAGQAGSVDVLCFTEQ
jgi:hypothetical protein